MQDTSIQLLVPGTKPATHTHVCATYPDESSGSAAAHSAAPLEALSRAIVAIYRAWRQPQSALHALCGAHFPQVLLFTCVLYPRSQSAAST